MTFGKWKYCAGAFSLLWLTACADPDTGGNGSEGEVFAQSRPQQLRGECADGTRIGGFLLAHMLDDELTFSYADGQVADAPLPARAFEQIDSSGPCRLLRKNNPFCDPRCTSGQVCDEGGSCIAEPPNQDVGSVFVEGLVEPIVMEPTSPGNLYFNTELPHPAFEPGVAIKLSALGGDLEGFTLYGDGVAPLQNDGQKWLVQRQQPLTISWRADAGCDTKVSATLDIDQHGRTPARITCQGPDTGSFIVSAELIDRLIDLGTSGFPTATLRRYTADSTIIQAGCVDLVVFSSLSVKAEVRE
jgi:hypothetical protein